jgi:thiopurine S-methyltransferase
MTNPQSQKVLDSAYWAERYQMQKLGWDIGYANEAMFSYVLARPKQMRILIPGAGRAWELEQLHRLGYEQVWAIDYAPEARASFLERVPDFPADRYLLGDFFEHWGEYDHILEQTFFCALDPRLRPEYPKHMARLLSPGGVLSGLLFDFPLDENGPPFGGSREEYLALFQTPPQVWSEVSVEPAQRGIPQRLGREFEFRLVRSEQSAKES